MKHIEDDHQRTLVSWADYTRLSELKHPVLPGSKIGDYLFSVPNGGKRNKLEAARMKGLGVRSGIPDLMLAIPAGRWHGLFVEMKRPIVPKQAKPKVSSEQYDKLNRFARAGYCCRVAYGFEHAKTIINDYLADRLIERLSTDWPDIMKIK